MQLKPMNSFFSGDNNDCHQVLGSSGPHNKPKRELEILSASEIPPDFYEVGILSGYRKPSATLTTGMLSIFQLHNETLNIWTQIIPAVYFVVELILNLSHFGDHFLIIYLIMAVTFLLTSSCAHTFSCLSPRARHICFFLDYIGITMYSCGCAVCYYTFALPVNFLTPVLGRSLSLCDLFLFVSVLFCICGTYLSCLTRFWKPSLLRNVVRMGAFSINLFHLAVPIAWRSYSCRYPMNDYDPSECSSIYYYHLHFLSIASAGFLYVSHLPERFFPGKFDIFGHSHQIFHVLSAYSCITQYYALWTDLRERSAKLKLILHAPSIPLALFCIGLVIFSNIIIFLKFYRRLCKTIGSKTL